MCARVIALHGWAINARVSSMAIDARWAASDRARGGRTKVLPVGIPVVPAILYMCRRRRGRRGISAATRRANGGGSPQLLSLVSISTSVALGNAASRRCTAFVKVFNPCHKLLLESLQNFLVMRVDSLSNRNLKEELDHKNYRTFSNDSCSESLKASLYLPFASLFDPSISSFAASFAIFTACV